MIKKMWANFKRGTYSILDNNHYNILPKKMASEYKPVWVTDRDPFENVRDVYEKHKHLDDILSEPISDDPMTLVYAKVWLALKKDLKNTEGSG